MFAFKKIAAQFLSPLSLTLELFVIGLFLVILTSWQKTGKTLIIAGAVILAFCSYTPTADILIESLKQQYPVYNQENALGPDQMPKLVVVLGAGVSHSSLPVVSRLGNDSMLRLIEGIRIYRMIHDGKLLLSGGTNSGSISSARDMAQLAQELGVNEQNIIIESNSVDTKDQAQIINSIIGDERFVLVTSASHMSRSMALFEKQGMKPIPAPTRSIENKLLNRGPNPFFPSSINLQKAEMAFHEYLGIIWAKLRNQI